MPFPSTDPTLPSYSDPLQWVTAYLVAHMMSDNSRRYMYILWICLACLLFVAGCIHWSGSRGGRWWAYWYRWSIRRKTWRGKYYTNLAKKYGHKAYPISLPPNGQLLALFGLLAVSILLAYAGPDYVSPSRQLFDISHNPLTARYDVTNYMRYQIQYSIEKAYWTMGSRNGLAVFALIPLCVIVALKTPPFALIALITETHFDKLSWFHRWLGRFIWLLTALHVGLWSVQLATDKRDGEMAYTHAWLYRKFIFGWIVRTFLLDVI